MFSPTFWRKFYLFAIPLAIVLPVRNGLMDFYVLGLAPSLRFCFEYNAVVWALWLLITPCLIRLFPKIIALPKRYRWTYPVAWGDLEALHRFVESWAAERLE
jgi:hypothetical protein